jgi:hypothetical protein
LLFYLFFFKTTTTATTKLKQFTKKLIRLVIKTAMYLENILKMPTVNQSLDQRLAHDFPIFESESSFPKQNVLNKSKSKRNYDELEDLFTLRKKLMTPYHFTHHGTTNKTRKANKAKEANKAKQQTKKNPKKKVNNKKSRKNNKNKAKGVTKFFNQFF